MKTKLLILLSLTFAFVLDTQAGSATWNLDPANGDWNTAANWTPNTVPDGPDDVATFEVSNRTAITVSTFISEVNELLFSPGASAFTITMTKGFPFTVSGTGITNNSGIAQNFVITKELSHLDFTNNATAGDMTFFTLTGGTGMDGGGGEVTFSDTSSAGNGTFVIYGAESGNGIGAQIFFSGNATAGNGSFTVKAGSQSSFGGGEISFFDNSTAANATFVIEGAAVSAGPGAVVFSAFDENKPTAGNGVFIINGGTSRTAGGSIAFLGGTGGNATLIANSGTNGGDGGQINFFDADESEARIELFGNGALHLFLNSGVVTVGSIEGDGLIVLSTDQKLIIGSNDLSTTFSGTIQDFGSGSLEKIGNGTLTLSGANTYTNGTSISQGTLVIANATGSGTGTGPIAVNAGTLGGSGIIAGATTVGTGNGSGAFLAPAAGTNVQATLTIQSALTFNADATYTYTFRAKRNRARTDRVIANGVSINSGALIGLSGQTRGALRQGMVLTVISNTSPNPISGTFANLPDGAIVTINGNNLQASYSGGDGNDLTLTVVP
jgi:autotransporter-associated beta strand protein